MEERRRDPLNMFEDSYQLLCTVSGRILMVSGALRLLLGGDPAGRNLNDYFEDELTARIVAAGLSGSALDFRCTMGGRAFSCSAVGVDHSIGITCCPLDDGMRVPGEHTAGLVAREMNSALAAMFLAMRQIRPQLIGEAREGGEVLSQNIFKLLRLSHNIADCALAQKGLLTLHITEEDAVRLCDGLVLRMNEPCRSRGIRLHWECPARPIPCRVDREKTERMLLNLISNAIAAQRGGGDVTLSVEERENTVVFTVADSGPGVTDGAALFQKYRTADPADPGSLGGAGFGLALTASFARLHGGQALYSGGPGGGAVFRLQLPLNTQGSLAPLAAGMQDYAGGVDRVLLELATVLNKESYC